MERKRAFWKMRSRVGFDAVLFKIQCVRVFFCDCWVKLKPSFPLPLPFFVGEEKQKCLILPKVFFGELPKPWPIPYGSQGSLWQICPGAHAGKEKQEPKANEGRAQGGESGSLGVPAEQGRRWKALPRFGSRLSSGSSAPRGAEAQGCWDCSLLFVYVHLEETCEQSCLLTAKEVDLRGTINLAWLFLSQVKP